MAQTLLIKIIMITMSNSSKEENCFSNACLLFCTRKFNFLIRSRPLGMKPNHLVLKMELPLKKKTILIYDLAIFARWKFEGHAIHSILGSEYSSKLKKKFTEGYKTDLTPSSDCILMGETYLIILADKLRLKMEKTLS